jgi:hypothetical protein
LSWRASAFVKPLTKHQDGTPLTAREKLILFVLADSHNDDYDCAWPSVRRAASQSLTSTSRFMDLIKRMESRGTIRIERHEGKSNRYYFSGLFRGSEQSRKTPFRGSEHTVPTRSEHTVPIAIGTEPPSSLQGTDIPPDSAVSPILQARVKEAEERSRLKRKVERAWGEALYENALRKQGVLGAVN